jgi:hypothetical protein
MKKFNFSKQAKREESEGFEIADKMLGTVIGGNADSSDVPEKNINASLPIKDKDNTVPFEKQLEAERKEAKSEMVTDKALDKSPKVYNDKRSDEWDTKVLPVNLVSESYDQKHAEAFAADSKTAKDDYTKFWDKYVGVQMEGEITKIDVNVPESGSQLQNSPDRFKFKDENVVKEIGSGDVEGIATKMVTASLKDADALLFDVYAKAFSEKRELTKEENQKIGDINNCKLAALTQSDKNNA